MGRSVHAEEMRERQNMRDAAAHAPDSHKLRVYRPHPSLRLKISETWGYGSKEEMEKKKEKKRKEYPEYEFEVEEA